MKTMNRAYWAATSLFVVFVLMAALPDVLKVPQAIAIFDRLGYPEYLIRFIGVAKLLSIVAILIPGFPRIKEWAYAGLCFDVIGALYSHLLVHDPVREWIILAVPVILGTSSYILYHKVRRAHRPSDAHSDVPESVVSRTGERAT
jgi:hypothetical protein